MTAAPDEELYEVNATISAVFIAQNIKPTTQDMMELNQKLGTIIKSIRDLQTSHAAELEYFQKWVCSNERKPATIQFTEGLWRNLGRHIESQQSKFVQEIATLKEEIQRLQNGIN